MNSAARGMRLLAVGLSAGLSALLLPACSSSTSSGHPDFANLVEEASPSVVNISTVGDPQGSDGVPVQSYDDAPEWFKRFLQEHGEDAPVPEDEPAAGAEVPQSLGSGFVLWEDGYVLTNYHVVRDAREVIVRLMDRRQLTAKVIGSDEPSDLALLKIDATDLPAVKLGDTAKLRPGQWVLAIGSPFGFDYSVTAGIVSAKGRSLSSEQYVPFIQTDVAINPGNSGGPLFNLKGEVVGVNSQIYSQSGGYQGVSFSIPIDVAAKVARQLRDRGKVTRGWLGVVVQEVDRNLAQSFALDKPVGALVAKVVPDGPAERAGLRVGDVILAFNGEELATSAALPPLVGALDPGQLATLDVRRDGKTVTIKVEVGVLDEQVSDLERGGPAAPEAPKAPLGLVVSSLTEAQRRDAQVLAGGVLVEDVVGGPGARAGIQPGDVLLSLGGQDIDSPERFEELASRLTPGASVPILISRKGVPAFLPLDVPAAPPPE